MHIIICEDEPYYQEAIRNAISSWIATGNKKGIRYTVFSSSEDLLERWENGLKIDFLFLDIQIPGELDGMSLARRIREVDSNLPIAFVTNYAHYVFEGYTVNAIRYLKKPIQDSELFSCLDVAYKHFLALNHEGIPIETTEQTLVLRCSDIIYLESHSHYVSFYLSTSDVQLKSRAKISSYSSRLPRDVFIQCHRSYIVNLMHIRRFTKNSITLSNNTIIPVSQTYFSVLYTAFNKYYQEGNV